MALESASAVLERALPANPALVYALLHRGELFEGLPRDDPGLRVPLANILAVIDHFTRALARSLGEGAAALDAGTVMAAIRHDSRAWRGDRLQRGADLHFGYEEGVERGCWGGGFIRGAEVRQVGWERVWCASLVHQGTAPWRCSMGQAEV